MKCFSLLLLGAVCQAAEPTFYIHTIAGSDAVADGTPATAAPLSQPEGVAIDALGNMYIADAADHRIRRIGVDGVITTLAGTGRAGFSGDGGRASAAQLSFPYGIAVSTSGDLYIADLGNARIRRVSPDGAITTVAGGGARTDYEGGPAVEAKLITPRNVAVDRSGVLYFSDFDGQRVYQVSTRGILTVLAGTGRPGLAGDGASAVLAELRYPAGVAVDANGIVHIADTGNRRIRRVTRGLIETVAIPTALFSPTGLAFDTSGNLYISDAQTLRLTPAGALRAVAPQSRDLTIGRAGDLYFTSGTTLQKLAPSGSASIAAGGGAYGFGGDGGAADLARFYRPTGVAYDSAGNLYIADSRNHRVRQISPSGTVTTIAGTGQADYLGDGGPAIYARLNTPLTVAADRAGNVYIADTGNHRVRRVTPGGVISTVAGNGLRGFGGEGTLATISQLDSPSALAFDADENLYIADAGNHRVRRVAPNGIITTVAGSGIKAFTGDGGLAVLASLDTPRGVAMDNSGNLYVADTGNNRVRRVNSSGVIASFGEGPWLAPRGLAVDGEGNVYAADTDNHRIRRIALDGQTATVAGTSQPGFSGDGGSATEARLHFPAALTLDANGSVVIADSMNDRIRKLTGLAAPPPVLERASIVHAASLLDAAVAPGQRIVIRGANIGPAETVTAVPGPEGIYENELAGVVVRVDGEPVPVLIARPNQVTVQAPFSLTGKEQAVVELISLGEVRVIETIRVAPVSPGLFTESGGNGQIIAVHEDGTRNSPTNPAPRNSFVTVYATGEGLTDPPGQTGRLAAEPLPRPVLPVRLQLANWECEIVSAGSAPGEAGVMQIVARLPGGFAPSGTLPLVLRVGEAVSQGGVVLSMR